MKFQSLILIYCVVFSLGEAQEHAGQAINEEFINYGPSSMHSINGKYYEERQKVTNEKPDDTHQATKHFGPDGNILFQLQDILTNMSDSEPTSVGEKILFRRNKVNEQSLTHPINSATINNFNTPQYNHENDASINNIIQETKANSNKLDIIDNQNMREAPKIQFHSENVISNYAKNKTVETIKKELAFESLLIKHDFNNINMNPTKIMNPSQNSNKEFDPEQTQSPGEFADNFYENPIMQKVYKPNRRLGTNANNEEISYTHHIPLKDKDYLLPIPPTLESGKDLRNVDNTGIPMQSHQKDENNVIPIRSELYHPTYSKHNSNGMSKNTLNQNYYNVIDKDTCDDKESDESLERNGNDIILQEPTKGLGISNVGKSRVMLMDHPRVCYACSSINDHSCWSPTRTTSVKYCRTDHPSCLIKMYNYQGLSYIIRDCGNTCKRNDLSGTHKYSACTICHQDLCNSAYDLKIHNITIIPMLMIFHILLNVLKVYMK